MNELQELEIRERLQAALDAGDELAELDAREALAALTQAGGQQPAQPQSGMLDSALASAASVSPQAGVLQGVNQMRQGDVSGGIQTALENSPLAVAGEGIAALGSGIAGQIEGGIRGLFTAGKSLFDGASIEEAGMSGGQKVRDVSADRTYQPRTAGGQTAMQPLMYLGRALEFLERQGGRGLETLAFTTGITDQPTSPAAQTIGELAPSVAGAIIPGGQGQRAARAAPKPQPEALRGIAQSIQAAESARPGSSARAGALEDVAARVDIQPEVVRAFEESGIQSGQIPAPVVSGSQEFRQVATAARSVPASPAAIQWKEFLGDVSRRVDELAAQADAQPLDVLNVNVSTKLNRTIEDARRAENEAYAIVEGADNAPGLIARNEAVDVRPTLDVLLKELEDVNFDETQMTEASRRTLNRIATKDESGNYIPKEMTWAGLTNLRKEMNAARKGQGGFKDFDAGEVERTANLISAEARRNAEAKGFGEEYALAMEATGVKKRAQEAAQQALGKNLDQSFSKILESRGNALAKGQIDEFRKVVNSLGDDQLRREAVSSFVFNKIIDTRNMDNRLAVADFSKWYNDLNAKPQAKAELYKYLDADTQKTIDNIGTMASAIKRANDDFIATGRLATLDDGFKLADSLVGKIGRYALMTKIGPVADMAAGAIQKQSRKLPEAASDLIGSSEFQNFVTRAMADPAGAKARAAERALMASAPWRRFYVRLPEAERTAIRNSGAIAWLQSQEPQEQQQGGGNR